MKTLKFQITGTRALMLNNAQTVSPFNEYTKRLKPLTSKRTKTEDDMLEISRIKFEASLYLDRKGRYIIPSDHFEQSIISAAKETKMGKKFERSFGIMNDCLLDFKDKDKTPSQLFDLGIYVDERAVGIKNVKISTTRAIFDEWSTEFECWYDETQLDLADIKQAVEIAGMRYGVGTYRKRYGRFEAKKIK